jgi:hypothetical protein
MRKSISGLTLAAVAGLLIGGLGTTTSCADILYAAQFNVNLTSTRLRGSPAAASARSLRSGLSRPFGLAFGSAGNLYAANYADNTIEKFTSGGVGSVFANTGLSFPFGVAFGSAGNLPEGICAFFQLGLTIVMAGGRTRRCLFCIWRFRSWHHPLRL